MKPTRNDASVMKTSNKVEARLLLFVARGAPYSALAEDAVRHLYEELPDGSVSLEVLDVNTDPRATLEHAIFVTPTLIRTTPEPVLRTTGPFEAAALKRYFEV